MENISEYSFGILGAGKLGCCLIEYLRINSNIKWIVEPNINLNFDFCKRYHSIQEIEFPANFILLALPDNQIQSAADQFANSTLELRSSCFIHFSGSLGKEVLNSLEAKSAFFAAHPFQTFYKFTNDMFDDISWGIDCDDENRSLSDLFIKIMKGKAHYFTNSQINQKSIYHAIGAVAANQICSTTSLAKSLAEQIELPVNNFLSNILSKSIDNVLNADINEFPLTGPIARKDISTVIKHIKSIADTDLKSAYIYNSISIIYMAKHYGLIDSADAEKMKNALIEQINK